MITFIEWEVKGGSVRNVGGVEKFFNSMGDEINIGDLTKENIRKGRIKEKFYNNEGVYYSPEETFNIARKETEELLKKNLIKLSLFLVKEMCLVQK